MNTTFIVAFDINYTSLTYSNVRIPQNLPATAVTYFYISDYYTFFRVDYMGNNIMVQEQVYFMSGGVNLREIYNKESKAINGTAWVKGVIQ